MPRQAVIFTETWSQSCTSMLHAASFAEVFGSLDWTIGRVAHSTVTGDINDTDSSGR